MRSLTVTVETRSMGTPNGAPFKKQINFLDSSDRKWLSKHCFWAMHNGYSVTSYPTPTKDDVFNR